MAFLDTVRTPRTPFWLWWFPVVVAACLFSIFLLDAGLALWLRPQPKTGLLWESWWRLCSEMGNSTWWLIGSVMCYLASYLLPHRKQSLRRTSLAVLAAVVASGITLNLLKIVFARPRPRMLFREGLYAFDWGRIGSDVGSFPSGHATTIAALAVIGAWLWPKTSWVWLTVVILVALSRVILGSHYLADVVAGGYVGMVVAFGVRAWLTQWESTRC